MGSVIDSEKAVTGSLDRPGRHLGRILLVTLNGATYLVGLGLTLLGLLSLLEGGRYDILGLLVGACAAYWAAGKIGAPKTYIWRFVAITIAVAAAAAWLSLT